MLLEIVVLTYENRDCLEALLNSVDSNDRASITVLDNSDKTSDIMNFCSDRKDIKYIKNKYNIGTANIMRAFEIAEAKYVWVVGCCNTFLKDGIKTVCDILEQDNPTALMHLENHLHRNPNTKTKRIYTKWEDILIEHSYSVACSLNSIIWRLDAVVKLIPVGYDSMTSMCPQASMLIHGVQNGSIQLVFYPVEVFNRHVRKRKWSMKQHIRWLPCIFPYTDQQSEENTNKFIQLLPRTDNWIFYAHD